MIRCAKKQHPLGFKQRTLEDAGRCIYHTEIYLPYLYLVDFYGKCGWVYIPYTDPMGYFSNPLTNHLILSSNVGTSLGQVFQTPEVARVFVSSFWNEAYRFKVQRETCRFYRVFFCR